MTAGPPPNAPVIGGRYVVINHLGGGANGEVYEVHDTYQGERVALKLLAFGPLGLWAEAAILTGLRDPHILPVRNADVDLGRAYLVTALATHGTLESATPPARGVAMELAVKWARQVCRGAARTHDAGLLHTDIKPGNIFLDDAEDALLGDFGLACVCNPVTGQGHHFGTAETMAPEVATSHLGLPGGSGATIASDVYSVGAVLYYLLAGRYAHRRSAEAPDALACMGRVVAEPAPALADLAPHVPRGLVRRVEQAMAHDPAARPPGATAFAGLLGDWPRPSRSWRRTDEHSSAHTGCWRGPKVGFTELTCCVRPSGGPGFIIETRTPSGNRVSAGCTTAQNESALPRALRRVFRLTQ